MSIDYIKFKENQNLVPLTIKEKERYINDLMNIEYSWTSRVDAQISNTFFLESVQLIINAIVLFEKGYFDCGFYSLRQSLEVSTTITYLIDLNEEQREAELAKWKSKDKFPMYGQMLEMLVKNKATFSDIKEKMQSYFDKLQTTKQKLNKYVHKQGFNTFYVSRNHPFTKSSNRDKFILEFEGYVKICIGAVAIFRLTIDPFPILLMDEEIYHRTFDMLTLPFTEEFIENYLGIENIELYKQTDIYKNHYDYLIKEEKKLPCVTNVVKDQYIDKTKLDEIKTQKHLLGKYASAAIFIVEVSDKISKVHCCDGLVTYFTNIPSKRDSHSFNSLTIKEFQESPNKYNNNYEGAFASCIKILDEIYCIEHNELFNEEEIAVWNLTEEFLSELTKKMKNDNQT